MTNNCKTCPVSTGTHKPAEAVHQIDEPQADALLELAAYRFTVANREARIAELESQLEAIGAGGVEPLRKGFVRLTDVLARLEQGFGANSAPVTTIKRHFEMQAAPAHPAEGVPDERAAFVNWLHGTYPNSYSIIKAADLWFLKHVAALAWQARAALAATQPAAQGLEADGMYYLQDARHHAMVGNCPSFWREGGGYTTNLDEAEHFTLEAAMKQHKCRETDLPWLCSEVDKLRRPTVDCQYMPRSWDAQRAALAAQAKQGAE